MILAAAILALLPLGVTLAEELSPALPADIGVAEAEEITSGWELGLSEPGAEAFFVLAGEYKGKQGIGGAVKVAKYHGQIGDIAIDPSLDIGAMRLSGVTQPEDSGVDNIFLTVGASLELSSIVRESVNVIFGGADDEASWAKYLSARVGAFAGINVEGDTAAGFKASLGVAIPL